MQLKFKTRNSTYEFGQVDGVTTFRRVEGKNPTLLPVEDGEWLEYREAVSWGSRLYIEWGDEPNQKITTSSGEWVEEDD